MIAEAALVKKLTELGPQSYDLVEVTSTAKNIDEEKLKKYEMVIEKYKARVKGLDNLSALEVEKKISEFLAVDIEKVSKELASQESKLTSFQKTTKRRAGQNNNGDKQSPSKLEGLVKSLKDKKSELNDDLESLNIDLDSLETALHWEKKKESNGSDNSEVYGQNTDAKLFDEIAKIKVGTIYPFLDKDGKAIEFFTAQNFAKILGDLKIEAEHIKKFGSKTDFFKRAVVKFRFLPVVIKSNNNIMPVGQYLEWTNREIELMHAKMYNLFSDFYSAARNIDVKKLKIEDQKEEEENIQERYQNIFGSVKGEGSTLEILKEIMMGEYSKTVKEVSSKDIDNEIWSALMPLESFLPAILNILETDGSVDPRVTNPQDYGRVSASMAKLVSKNTEADVLLPLVDHRDHMVSTWINLKIFEQIQGMLKNLPAQYDFRI